MLYRNSVRILALASLAMGVTGCGLLGLGSTAAVIIAVVGTGEEAETEYVYPEEAEPVLATATSSGPAGARVTAFGGAWNSNLFMGTHRGGLFKSTNGGTSWTAVNEGFDRSLTVTAIAVDNTDPDTVLVGTGLQYAGGVYRSTDANTATTWELASAGLGSLDVRDLVKFPVASNAFLAGTGAGLYRTDDDGDTWTDVTVDTTTGLSSLSILDVEISPISDNVIFVATAGGVYYTGNGGGSWTQRSGGLPDLYVTSLAYHSTVPTLYASTKTAGVFVSVDSGVTWTPTGGTTPLNSLEVLSVSVDPLDANRVYAGTAAGLAVTGNAGDDWVDPAGTLPTDSRICRVMVDPADSARVYAGGYSHGAFISTDALTNENFDPANVGVNATVLSTVALDANRHYIAGGYSIQDGSSVGAVTYDIAGTTWITPTTAPGGDNITALAGHPTTNFTVYAAVEGVGVHRTTSGGTTWNLAWTPADVDVISVVVVTTSGGFDTLLAGCDAHGAYRSDDGGATWTAVTGLTVGASVRDFAVDPVTATRVYAATDTGVYASSDGGSSWTASTTPIDFAMGAANSSSTNCVLVDPETVSVVYAGTAGGGVFVSLDSGDTWDEANKHIGGSANVHVRDLAAQTVSPYYIFVAASTGLFRSANKTEYWNPVHDDDTVFTEDWERRILVARRILVDTYSTDQKALLVATEGRGLVTLQFP